MLMLNPQLDVSSEHDQMHMYPTQMDVLLSMIDAIEEGVLAVTPNSEALGCNQQFLDIWQIPSELATDNVAMMKNVLERLEHPDQFVEQSLAINRDPEARFRDEVRLKDGRLIERTTRPVCIRHKLIHRIWCFRDITVQRQIEELLREHQHLL